MSGGAGARCGGEPAAALLLAITILVFAPSSFVCNAVADSLRPSVKNDFTSYYVAGLAVRQGMPEALYYPKPVGSLLAQASQEHPWIDLARSAGIDNPNYYLYPPLFAVLFAPLTLLPYRAAYVLWTGLSAALFVVCLALLLPARERGAASTTKSPLWLLRAASLVLVASLFYPVSRTLAVGQSSLLLAALMTAAWVTLRRADRAGDLWGGVCLAGGVLLKLTPAVFLLWLAMRRRWRALGFTAAALVALLGGSILVVGLQPHAVYFGEMVGRLAGGTAFYPNQSLPGLTARLGGADMRLADLVDPAGAGTLIARLLGLGLMAGTFLVIWRRALDDDHAFCLLILAALAVSPISWEHHYVLALIPAGVLLRDASAASWMSPARGALSGAALALIGSYVGLRVIETAGGGALSALTASACLLGGLILWGLFALAPSPRAGGAERGAGPAPGPAPAPRAALLAMVCVFAAGTFLLKVLEYNRTYRYGDFTSYYVAAATLVDGGPALYYPQTPDMILARAETPSPWTETASRWGVRDANYYLYPPFFAIAMTPLTALSYGAAHNVWYIANLAALGGCVWLFAAAGRRAGGPIGVGTDAGGAGAGTGGRCELALAVVGVALSWPALFTFGAGQANFVVLLLLLGALAALRAGREAPAGLMTAGAAAIKLTPALLLVYLAWRRRWVALAAGGAGLAALVLAGAAAAGWSSYEVYTTGMVPLLSRGCAHWVNESLAALFSRLIDGGDLFSWALGQPSSLSRALSAAAGLGLVAGAFALAGRNVVALDLEFSLMVVTTLFVSPLSWTHHSVLSLMAFLLAARHLIARERMTVAMAAALAVSFTLVHVYVKPPGFLQAAPLNLLASYNLIGNLMLWGILAILLRRARATSPAPATAAAA